MSERPSRLSPEYTAWADEKIVSLGRRVAELEKGLEEYACTGTDEPCGCYNLITKDRARVAELEAENARIWDALLPFQCTGCGSTKTIEQIRAEHPGALSCCPERDMQPRAARAEAVIHHVLARCNDNGGEIDRELVAEIKAALGEDATACADNAQPRPAQSPAGAAWQPIETAPKDGTEILCWVPHGSYAGISINRWKNGHWWATSIMNPPTRWMPLPLPPDGAAPR